MKRGEIWIVAGGKAHAGKPRPVVILQDHRFDMTDREHEALAEFWPRQPLLFEPNHAFTFGLIDYQETLKPRYQADRLLRTA